MARKECPGCGEMISADDESDIFDGETWHVICHEDLETDEDYEDEDESDDEEDDAPDADSDLFKFNRNKE